MLRFTTGNIVESHADCLINTVNCEGYMGKGIAYQFKLKFPENNKDYVRACRSGALRIGTIHYYHEHNKVIINFPTKDKWREKSKIEYIETGLQELNKLIPRLKIRSIAIPPLGCGNGGLNWNDVKVRIIDYLNPYADNIDIIVFEPSQNINNSTVAVTPPKLNASHLILMTIKKRLKHFNKLRLQKGAYFVNLFAREKYFKFGKHKFGPYAHSIDILTKQIKEFQDFYHVDTDEAYNMAIKTLISKTIESKLSSFYTAIIDATNFVNELESDDQLEIIATLCNIVEDHHSGLSEEEIIRKFKDYSEEKKRYSEKQITDGIKQLKKLEIIEETLFSTYIITSSLKKKVS